MAKLIIIRGNSGSGKTSLAKALQEQYKDSSMVISQDLVRREMLSVSDGPDTATIPLLYHLLEYGRQNYEITILEGILASKWYTPLFERAYSLFNGDVFGYYYDLPFEETIKRHYTKPVASEYGEKDLRRWWQQMDILKGIPERLIAQDVSIADAVNTICQDITRKRH